MYIKTRTVYNARCNVTFTHTQNVILTPVPLIRDSNTSSQSAYCQCNPFDWYSISIQDPGNNNLNNNYITTGPFLLKWKIIMVKICIEHDTDLY